MATAVTATVAVAAASWQTSNNNSQENAPEASLWQNELGGCEEKKEKRKEIEYSW